MTPKATANGDAIFDAKNNDEPNNPTDQFRLGYVTDVEGHWGYFLEYVRRSNVLDWDEDVDTHPDALQKLTLRPNTHFIYGGDSVDKGPGDIRLCRALASLKKRYPYRVSLLVGNRDLNKIRMWSELSDADMKRPLEDIPPPFWDRNAPSFKEYLEKEVMNKEATNGATLDDLNTRVERLRWMLKHTLGCPDTFEFRREELRVLREIHGAYPEKSEDDRDDNALYATTSNTAITDEEVVESFRYEVSHPEGSLRQYLEQASIAAIVGNTIFVHGAIDSLTMKYVPSLSSKFEVPKTTPPTLTSTTSCDGTVVDDVHEWVKSLNSFLQQGMKDFVQRPDWNDERTSRGGEALLAIQNRPAMWGRSVVCNSYCDGGVIATTTAEEERKQALHSALIQSDPLAFEGIASNVFDTVPAQWLLEHGIQRIVVGHKPSGDCPAVLSSEYTGVEVVSADTSFSHRRELQQDDDRQFGPFRGNAIAMVELTGPDQNNNWLETTGTLACGAEYFNRFPLLGKNEFLQDAHKEVGDVNLGKRLSDGWWIKGTTASGEYHLCRGTGRFVEYDLRSAEEVAKTMKEGAMYSASI